jgi:plastocyanin
MRGRVVALSFALMSGLVLSGCGSKDTGGAVADSGTTASTASSGSTGSTAASGAATKVEITAKNIAFDKTAITLTAGQDVQFVLTNADSFTHNLTIEGLGVNKNADGGKTESAPVTKALAAGSYPFHCAIHPDQMKGTITVS